MPRTPTRYPQVISTAVTQQLYDRIMEDVTQQESRMSAVVRSALEEHYDIQASRMLTIVASKEEVAKLRGLGYRIAEQE